MQSICSPLCASRYVREAKKEAKRKDKAKLESLKPLRKLLSEAQTQFNRYIRARDEGKVCISCGRMHQGAWDAGHYFTTRARPDLRFDEANVHRQCVPCNQFLSGNIAAYRLGLLARIGADELARLEGPPGRGKYTRDEAAQLKATYAAKARAMGAKAREAIEAEYDPEDDDD
jgi:hypothetical protein